jgi:hypothetical protein
MPNHITNQVTFLGSTERIKELRELCKTEKSPFSFQAFYPIPDELVGTTSPAKIVTEKELQEWKDKLAKGELTEFEKNYRPITKNESKRFIKKYGADNWYNWQIENWGTKWDCYSHVEVDECQIHFDTAWSTPMHAMAKLSLMFDDITIEVKYADEDFGSNVGTYTLQSGEIVDVYQPEYSKESVKLAMQILSDTEYWLTDRLCELEDDTELDGFDLWLVEIAHEEGYLLEEYPICVIIKLKEFAVHDQQYERATTLRNLEKLKLNSDNLDQ